MDPNDFRVLELKGALSLLGASTSGTKAELIARLQGIDPTGNWMLRINEEEAQGSQANMDKLTGTESEGHPRASPPQLAESNGQDRDVLMRLLEHMTAENRRRDEMFLQMMSQISNQIQPRPSELMNYHIMPDLTKTIRDFNGEEGGAKAKEWLNDLRSMQTLHRWSDNFALETAGTHLKGGVYHWYTLRSPEVNIWQQFQELFKNTFLVRGSMTERWRRMVERVQKKGESLPAYYHEKVKLCRKVELDFLDTREQVLAGLWSKDLCAAVTARDHRDEDDLLHDLLSQKRLHRHRLERIKAVKDSDSLRHKETSTQQTVRSRQRNDER